MTALRYAIAGSGRWAGLMSKVLAGKAVDARVLSGLRWVPGESPLDYRERLKCRFGAVAADVVWLAVPPGPHVGLMIEAALAAHADVVVEKPWMSDCGNADTLATLAKTTGHLVAVHFEYCFLDAVLAWRENSQYPSGVTFEGAFTISRPDRLRLPAIQNLGSHLMAIHHFAVPQTRIGFLDCGYERGDSRSVRLIGCVGGPLNIDFTGSTEPVIQRFIAGFERARLSGVFPLDLTFADSVRRSLSIQAGAR